MSDSAPTSKSRHQQVAEELALILGGFEESILVSDKVEKMLTPMQDVLISDAFGLLNGIAHGNIATGQPRIRDNLIQVVQQISGDADSKIASKLLDLLSTVISRAAASGLTADSHSFIGLHQQSRSR